MTLFLSTVPKIASFAFAFRLLAHGMGSVGATWQEMLAPLAVLSMVFGNVVAIAQSNLKRMLAYSAIGNVGFILLGFVAGSEAGYEAALYYTVAYVIMTLGSFGVLVLASRQGFEAEDLDHFKGLHKRDPLLALVMMALMFSTAGVPPFIGFWAKFNIFQALWLTGHYWLILIAAAASVVGVFYYLRIVKLMYFDAPGELPSGPSSGMAVRSRAGAQWIGGAGSRNRAQRVDSALRPRDRLREIQLIRFAKAHLLDKNARPSIEGIGCGVEQSGSSSGS